MSHDRVSNPGPHAELPYDPCVVRTEAPSERSDNSGEGVGRLPGRQDDEHGDDGLQGLVVYSL